MQSARTWTICLCRTGARNWSRLLTQEFGVPAENLSTQGYGEQYLKVPTEAPEQANRRVAVRRITPLLSGQIQ